MACRWLRWRRDKWLSSARLSDSERSSRGAASISLSLCLSESTVRHVFAVAAERDGFRRGDGVVLDKSMTIKQRWLPAEGLSGLLCLVLKLWAGWASVCTGC